MNNISYSIIIPHKNIPNLLQRCLDTIPQRDDIQVIVIDDNSDDSIVDFNNFPKWAGIHYEYYLTKGNNGAGFARNYGLKYAKGQWIIFADADDCFITQNLSRLLELPEKQKYDVIIWPTEKLYANGTHELISPEWGNIYGGYNYNLLGTYQIIDCNIKDILYRLFEPWHKMIRHNHIANNKLTFSEVIYCNDLLFSEKLAYHTQNIGVFSDVVYQYNKREESLSDVNSLYKIKQRLLEFFKVQKFLITINKAQYLHKLDWQFEVIMQDSMVCAIYYCLIQMHIVSFKIGLQSLRKILTIHNIRIKLALNTRIRSLFFKH